MVASLDRKCLGQKSSRQPRTRLRGIFDKEDLVGNPETGTRPITSEQPVIRPESSRRAAGVPTSHSRTSGGLAKFHSSGRYTATCPVCSSVMFSTPRNLPVQYTSIELLPYQSSRTRDAQGSVNNNRGYRVPKSVTKQRGRKTRPTVDVGIQAC